jgi:hypothetical protein
MPARPQIERGKKLGFTLPPTHADGIAWVLVSKASVNERLLELFSGDDADTAKDIVAKELENQRRPYTVQHYELRREVHESGDYGAPEDVLVNDIRRFATLEEAGAYLRERWGLDLDDAQDRAAIDAP